MQDNLKRLLWGPVDMVTEAIELKGEYKKSNTILYIFIGKYIY